MNRYLPFLLLLLIAGCAQRSTCPTKTSAELVSAITTLITAEGMTITDHNPLVGILQASATEESLGRINVTTSRHWTFTIKDGLIGAYARVDTSTRNAAGVTIDSTQSFYSETAPDEWKWFWNVRRGLESICGTQVDFLKLN